MKHILLISVLTAFLSSCEASPGDSLRYLALGDSYTIGESVSGPERYPEQLAAKLTDNGNKVETVIIARTGWTTDELSAAIERADLKGGKFDLVTLLIGVNNEYRGRGVEEYKRGFEELLDRAVELAGGKRSHVIVVSIPDYGYTPFGAEGQNEISKRIDLFNAAAKGITEEKGVKFSDITPISRNGFRDRSLVADDGLHPSGKQYGLWADQLLPLALQALR
jgi:lysophospholipase L1-like esterase